MPLYPLTNQFCTNLFMITYSSVKILDLEYFAMQCYSLKFIFYITATKLVQIFNINLR